MNTNRVIRKSTVVFFAVVAAVFTALTLYGSIGVDLTTGIFLGGCVTIPTAILGWLVLSLVLYLRAKKQSSDDLPALKSRLQVAIALLVFLAIVIAALIGCFALAISHM